MNKFVKISLFLVSFLIITAYASQARAEVLITNTQVSAIADGRAKLEWRTNRPTKATIYYGDNPNVLPNMMGYSVFSYDHETSLTGLKKDKTYYYQIIVQEQGGPEVEAFVQSFSTKGMKDTVAPTFNYQRVEQVTANAVAIRLLASEDVKVNVSYGVENSTTQKDKTTSVGSYKTEQIIYLYDLIPQTSYHAKVQITDNGGNKANYTFYFDTNSGVKDGSAGKIYSVEPITFDPALITPTSTTIKWRSILFAKSYISYGDKPGNRSKNINPTNNIYGTEFQALIKDLKPNTKYYYVIIANNSLYGKSITSPEYSFTTSVPQKVLSEKISDDAVDSDQDSLTNAYELSIATDPFNSDTDGDGYNDGLEVANKYNPLGYGRAINQVLAKPSILSPYEQTRTAELKTKVASALGTVKLSLKSWVTLANAYTFGGYSLNDINMTIKGGKTVHPTIPFEIWQTSKDYQQSVSL